MQYPLLEQEGLGARLQRRRVLQTESLLKEERLQGLRCVRSKELAAQMRADPELVFRNRVLPHRILFDPADIQVHLDRDELQEFVLDLQRLLGRQAVEESHETDLIGEAQAVMVPPALGHRSQVFGRKGGLLDQLLAGIRDSGHQTGSIVEGKRSFPIACECLY